jgi:hypothetical protein
MQRTLSSSGWRSTSGTCRLHSGRSSGKSTPWWARDASPGLGTGPPLKLISETVCWGHGTGAGEAGDAVDVIGLEGFGQVHRWQDSGEAACLLPLLVYHHCRRFSLAFLEIVSALAKCERDEQRWAEAYSAEVINATELKGYRAETDERRQSLLSEQPQPQGQLKAIGQHVVQVETLIDYRARVRQALRTFEVTEKRHIFEALDLRVTWTPGQPPSIQGAIPMDAIAPIPPARHRRYSAACESRA